MNEDLNKTKKFEIYLIFLSLKTKTIGMNKDREISRHYQMNRVELGVLKL